MKYEFILLTMKTKNGKKLYLKEGKGKSFEWTFDKKQALWFCTLEEIKEFADNYFKNFKNYSFEDFDYYI